MKRTRLLSLPFAAALALGHGATALADDARRPSTIAAEPGGLDPNPAEADPPNVVETIEGNSPARAPQPEAPVAPRPAVSEPLAGSQRAPENKVQEPASRFELAGWARQALEVGLWKRSAGAGDPAPDLPYNQLVARTQLFLRARYSRANWFEANVSGALSYSVFEQQPLPERGGFNGFNGQRTLGLLEPHLHELFVGFFSRRLDVRIGQQRLAWGNSDFASPNDVMNARDLRDPFLSEAELRYVPTFLLRADLDLGFASVQAVLEPVFTPDRYDVYGSNWAAIQPDAPRWASALVGIARGSIDPSLEQPAQRMLAATRYPASDFSQPVPGARFSWSAQGVDMSYYYQYGFDGPLVAIDPALSGTLSRPGAGPAGLSDLQPLFAAIDAGQEPLRVYYVRRHHVGLDVGTTLGQVALRVDAAYDSQRVFYRTDLNSALSPAFAGVVSVEYQTGHTDRQALLEALYFRIMNPPASRLLVYERDTLAVAANFRWPLWRWFGVGLRALAYPKPRSLVMQPELETKLGAWVISVGGLWLDGDAYSFGRHFQRNTEGYARVKVLF